MSFNKNMVTLALLVTSASSSAALQSFDSRSHAMGGVGVSSSDYLTAAFHNPALVSKYNDSDDVGVLLPSIGAQVSDSNELIDQLDNFSDVYGNLENNQSQENADTVIEALEKMKGDSASIQAGVGMVVAIPNDVISVAMFTKAYADAYVLAAVDDSDLDSSNLTNPNPQLDSKGVTMGVSILEAGVALSKSIEFVQGTLYVGLTPKYQQVNTINYIVDIDSYEFDDWDQDQYQNEESNFNADIGIAYEMPQGFVFGLSGRNLIEQTYKTTTTSSVSGEYTINPVYTVGASFNHPLLTVALDIDLNENERYSDINGLDNLGLNSDSDNTQMAGIGAEFNAWNWAQVRLGYQHDIAGTFDDQITAGIGLSPFGALHLDLSASYSGENEFGAVIQTYMTF